MYMPWCNGIYGIEYSFFSSLFLHLFLKFYSVVLVSSMCVKLLSRVRLCNPVDCSPPGSSVHGILQARYWSGLPFPSPRDLPGSPALHADALSSQSSQLHHSLQTCLHSFQSGHWLTSSQSLRSHRRKALRLAECCKSPGTNQCGPRVGRAM